MGSYCTLYIDDYPILSTKSYAESEVMTIFRADDKYVEFRHLSERNKLFWGEIEAGEEDVIEEILEYKAPVRFVRERLEVMGFTMQYVMEDFENIKSRWIQEQEYFMQETKGLKEKKIFPEEMEVIKSIAIQDYLTAWKKAIFNKRYGEEDFKQSLDLSQKEKFIFFYGDIYTNYPMSDRRSFLRLLIEVLPDDAFFIQELTEVVHSGYYDRESPLEEELSSMNGDITASKIIILNEGSIDSRLLKRSMKLLYPHLFDYYHFMDFDFNPAGGAGNLINNVKSFAASGINNRIIAIFDNDSAGHEAANSIKNITLPENIVIQMLPHIEIARNYPIDDLSYRDINGCSCSIELFLGEDVLRDNKGQLIPVSINTNGQGKINCKNEIHRKFEKKLALCESNPANINKKYWHEINLILQNIFKAFH